MRVTESGNDHRPACVDDPRVFSDQSLRIDARADQRYRVAAYDQALSPWLSSISGPHSSVDDGQFRCSSVGTAVSRAGSGEENPESTGSESKT